MLVIPLWPDLRVGAKPVVTLSLVALCSFVYFVLEPASVDAWLYQPQSLNPFTMLSSSIVHADLSHYMFNMLFYVAFAVALETAIGNAWRYLAIIVTIMLGTGISYSLYCWMSGDWRPTLGFSGVVTGMIGLSAYLMPKARIRTFVWFITFANFVYVPAWIFAGWYIGTDFVYLLWDGHASGTNLAAHVSGGLIGYGLGYWWLRDRKWLIAEQLEDEIDLMRSRRSDFVVDSHVNKAAFKAQEREDAARHHRRAFLDELRRVERLNNNGRLDEALETLLGAIDNHGPSEALLEEVLDTVLSWPLTLFTLNYARYHLNYLLDRQAYKAALNACERCLQVAPDFVLARPLEVLPLARMAEKQQRRRLAYALVRNAPDRYGDALDLDSAREMEARLRAAGDHIPLSG